MFSIDTLLEEIKPAVKEKDEIEERGKWKKRVESFHTFGIPRQRTKQRAFIRNTPVKVIEFSLTPCL